MTPLGAFFAQLAAGCAVVLFGLMVRSVVKASGTLDELCAKVAALSADVSNMKEFWLRTAERRDDLLKATRQWQNYALRAHGIDPKAFEESSGENDKRNA